ncbi:hypothetical protein BH24ACT26_BH24ACT26_02620 [soil metagenome]
MTTLVGGVGQLYQGDLDLGRLAVERLREEELGASVLIEDFHYGAVAVAQRLEDVRPDALVLVGAVQRGSAPASVARRRIKDPKLTPAEIQSSVGDAVTGYVTLDLAIEVAAGLGALPARTVAIEVEAVRTSPSESMTPEADEALEEALGLVRAEIRRAPLLRLADELRALLDPERLEPSPALDALKGLLLELRVLDDAGRWGAAFAIRDRLRRMIAEGATGHGMDHLDWGLWWALIEELDRLQPLEASVDD